VDSVWDNEVVWTPDDDYANDLAPWTIFGEDVELA
jgi:hypothetical protein